MFFVTPRPRAKRAPAPRILYQESDQSLQVSSLIPFLQRTDDSDLFLRSHLQPTCFSLSLVHPPPGPPLLDTRLPAKRTVLVGKEAGPPRQRVLAVCSDRHCAVCSCSWECSSTWRSGQAEDERADGAAQRPQEKAHCSVERGTGSAKGQVGLTVAAEASHKQTKAATD